MSAAISELRNICARRKDTATLSSRSSDNQDAGLQLELGTDRVELIDHCLIDRVQSAGTLQAHDRPISAVLDNERVHQTPVSLG